MKITFIYINFDYRISEIDMCLNIRFRLKNPRKLLRMFQLLYSTLREFIIVDKSNYKR